jgi:putative spermidine/putrescine transport system ATP-binding protein
MPMANVKLSLRGVGKFYGAVAALKPTSLDVPEGEFLTLLGPSGSGKTTLLQLLAGLIEPDEGEIWIDGRMANGLAPNKRDIGLVFQNYALFPHLTVAENIAFPLQMRGVGAVEIKRRTGEILDIVRLPDVGDRFPLQLSGGQQQRIAFARCAVYRPSVILMDEPLGALDRKLRDQMQAEIRRLHRELGATILYVTHDQEEAMAMSDRICLLNEGAIAQIGTPTELYFAPKSLFAADFLGSANMLKGKVTARDGETLRVALGTGEITGRSDASLGIADDVVVVIRPEAVSLLGEGREADNVVEARIEQRTMIGPLTRLEARLADDVKLASLALTTPELGTVDQGATVRLGWKADSAIVLVAGRT